MPLKLRNLCVSSSALALDVSLILLCNLCVSSCPIACKSVDFYTIHNANLVTDILTNPTVVHLHVKMHAFYSNHIANLVADILTNPTVVHPYVEINDAYPIHIANLVTDMLTNPTVQLFNHTEMHEFYAIQVATLSQTCLQTLQFSYSIARKTA